ncbi:GntR family transcriptional regulator [Pseudonocardia spirodelae]|uniref:GntR family transcriptional regulator n=1 Tax=Pseudonocardia spirodelae TaxID=3133431 RepID=A0ABU8T2C7_9PSEU
MSAAQGTTKRDQIVDALRRDILAGELARGVPLRQDELARRFGTSITPVREALSVLSAEGLVVAEHNRGVRVAGVDPAEVAATYVVRRLTESYAVRRAAPRISPRDLARARAVLDRPAADPAAARERNREFHFLLYDRCGLPALTGRIAAMWQAFPWDLTLHDDDRAAASRAEHEAILDAIAAGDPDGAAAATEHHVARGFASLARALGTDAGAVTDPFDDLD